MYIEFLNPPPMKLLTIMGQLLIHGTLLRQLLSMKVDYFLGLV